MKLLYLTIFTTFIAFSSTIAEDTSIGNRYMRRTFSIEKGRLFTKEIQNKVAGLTAVPCSCDEFRIRISQGTHTTGTDVWLTSADFKAKHVSGNSTEQVFLLQNEKHGLTVELQYTLKPEDFYAHKWLTITAEKPVTLERIDVEAMAFNDAFQPYKVKAINSHGKWSPGLGQPLYTTNSATFWGIEFPAAFNFVKGKNMNTGYLWGFELEPGKPYETKKAVVGVADDPQYIQEAFFHYIDRVRARPLRLQTQYNSWFNCGRSVSRERFQASIETIHQKLNIERGVPPLRAYVIDAGWQTKNDDWTDKTWKVNEKFDPDFASSRTHAERAGSRLGLWLSPGCNFGAKWVVPRYREKGFEALDHFMSLAGPKYMRLLETRMVELAKLGISYFKLDGLFGHRNLRDFELNGNRYGIPWMPQLGTVGMGSADPALNDHKYDELKIYYLAAGTERLIRIFDRLGKINPDIYILISNGAWLSPWWLMHIDAVWMINAGDAARGADRTKELVYRDSIYYQIWAQENTQYPMHSLFNHEPKKRQSGESKKSFRDYLYMSLSRGTGLVELYITPGILQEPDWDVLAEGLLWVHDVFPLFRRVRMHGGNPKTGEVYGYTAWNKTRGYISIHNPADEPQTYSITLDRSFGLIPDSGPFQISSPMADSTTGLKTNWKYGDTLSVELKPREIRILNFDPVSRKWKALRELQVRHPDPVPSAKLVAEKKKKGKKKEFASIPENRIVPPAKFIGIWEYRHGKSVCTREFTQNGMCILTIDGKVNWEKPVTGHKDNVVLVAGKYKHEIIGDGCMKIENKYTALKQGSNQ